MSKNLVGLMVLFFFSFVLFATMVIFREPIGRITRAKEDLATSERNTVVLAWPLRLPADGKSKCKITVFVRSTNGKPLSNKNVTLTSSSGAIDPSLVISDKEGKAEFQLSSSTPGIAEIEATADNLKVIQKISVKFE